MRPNGPIISDSVGKDTHFFEEGFEPLYLGILIIHFDAHERAAGRLSSYYLYEKINLERKKKKFNIKRQKNSYLS